ncbi:MAG: hypothetical protein ABH867_00755 [Patescibacteria group bacterium]
MKVLVLSPEKKDKQSRKRRRLIVRALEDSGTKLLNPYPGRPPKKPSLNPSLFPKIFYQNEIGSLEKTDLVIADLSDPDFKIGFLTSQSLILKKPVLGLFWQEIAKEKLGEWKDDQLLFIESFSRDNIRFVLRQFLRFTKRLGKRNGKLIVIDGADGSGKATQSKLLVEFLRKKGEKVKFIDFPRYYSSFHGKVVSRYLKGEFGQLNQVDPHLASLTYALDRLTAKEELEDWLKKGNLVVANRYTSANMAHQTGRVEKSKRKEFLNWLIEMEYKVHKLPKEDLVIFLHLPFKMGQKLVDRKGSRGYRGSKKRDLHEASDQHLRNAEKMYLYLAERFSHWVKIDCLNKKGKILSRGKIHKKILAALQSKGVLELGNADAILE